MMRRFEGRTVIVTGAASGIGRAAARRFAQEGARVCAADISAEGLAATVAAIADAGGEAFACTADVSAQQDNERVVAETVARFGPPYVAFLNAGYLGPMDGFEATDLALFDRHIAINLRGCFLGLKAVFPVIRSGGAVVVTSSTAAMLGLIESPAYSAAKHGVVGLVKSTASAFAARGVRINAICPGVVNTPMLGHGEAALVAPDELVMPPLGGGGSAQHVAELALYLASPSAAFSTGSAVICDAGLLSSFREH